MIHSPLLRESPSFDIRQFDWSVAMIFPGATPTQRYQIRPISLAGLTHGHPQLQIDSQCVHSLMIAALTFNPTV